VIILAYALRSTAWGRHVYAVGDDPEAAELAGVDVHRTLMSVYMLAGFICALAAWVMIGRFSSVSPSASTGVVGNIQAITAVVIGGISLFGGRGSIVGAFFGAQELQKGCLFCDILTAQSFVCGIKIVCGQNDLPHAERHDERGKLYAAH
jgi:ribose/xylose/arabinose/galactoside ABC-type transport system permease subunit